VNDQECKMNVQQYVGSCVIYVSGVRLKCERVWAMYSMV